MRKEGKEVGKEGKGSEKSQTPAANTRIRGAARKIPKTSLFDRVASNDREGAQLSKNKSLINVSASGSSRRPNSSSNTVASTNMETEDLEKEPWFHGLLTRDDVKPLLKEEGDFMVRTSIDKDGVTVSMKVSVFWRGEDKHFVVHKNKAMTDFYIDEKLKFENVRDLVSYYMQTKEPLTPKCDARLLSLVQRADWELDHGWIELQQLIGKGAFGEVYRGTLMYPNKKDAIEVAIKTYHGKGSEKERENLMREARLMRKYDHKNIVKLYGIAAQRSPVYIVMELVPGGSLITHLRTTLNITIKERVRFATHIARGMEYLESRKCVHRDLAARNCLIGKMKEIKIADFGLSSVGWESTKTVVGGDIADSGGGANGAAKVPVKMSVKWTAPESLLNCEFSHKSDVWSFGIVIFEIFSGGKEPYNGIPNAEIKQGIVDGTLRCEIPSIAPDPLFVLLERCWDQDPDSRPAFSVIRKSLERLKDSL